MDLETAFVLLAVASILGVGVGYLLRYLITLSKRGSIELELKQMMLESKEQAENIVFEAKEKALQMEEQARAEAKEKEDKLQKTEERLVKKEELLDNRQLDIDREVEHLKKKIGEIKEIKDRADALEASKTAELAKIANLSPEEAKAALLQKLEKEHEEDLQVRSQKLELFSQEKLDRRAKEILIASIHRLGNSVAAENMATSVPIPSDDLKGKIIGKEGRNIKAFERATGVEVLIDDTPGMITLSSFDPVRRQIARIALEALIADGRIQPAKIEEVVEKAKADANQTIKEKGEQAAYECGVFNLDPRLVSILGRLHYRTSYGQNVLQHSIEMAHIAGVLAAELGANVAVAKAGALLHDIGKAVDHEVQGTHVEIGRRILEKFGVEKGIIQAMQAHHEEYPYETVESIIVQVADAISGGRPGARRDSVENYLKRLGELEGIAKSFPGVEKTYAIQAGREVRVFVYPDQVSDLEARALARKIALRIENELKYPGEIKVNVIREARSIEFAR
ncbi:MAG TPA: ribonuclease Y [Candidatus Paceibacterota bacterium]|nr:ribonuclease Y [Candidatus Paceibacterota bacterium]